MEEKSRLVKRRIYTTLIVSVIISATVFTLLGGLSFSKWLGAVALLSPVLAIPVYAVVKALLPVKPVKVVQNKPPKNVSGDLGEALNMLLGGEDNIVGYNKPENMGYDNSTNDEDIFVVVIKDFGKIDKASLETARENGAEVLEFVTQGRRVLRLHIPKNNSTLLVMPKDEEYA